jgi:hypothetical protein
MRQLRAWGKRLIVFRNDDRSVFDNFTFPNDVRQRGDVPSVRNFSCSVNLPVPYSKPFYYIQGDVTRYTFFGVQLDNSQNGSFVLNFTETRRATACHIVTSFDLASSELLAETVWSWARKSVG